MDVTGMDRLQQLECLDALCSTAKPWERFLAGLACGLIQAVLVSWILSLLPPPPDCYWNEFDVLFGVCAVEAPQDRPPAMSPAIGRGPREGNRANNFQSYSGDLVSQSSIGLLEEPERDQAEVTC